ncbi:MAG: fasciclin domain-containing protein [Dongiaceae bacterium]
MQEGRMRISFLITASCALILSAGIAEHRAKAVTADVAALPQATRVADIMTGTGGIETWTRIVQLGGLEDLGRPAQTLFVPSDAAFKSLPAKEVAELLAPGGRDLRRAFLARAASESRIAPEAIAGKRISIATLDGRLLTIDATGEELMVGDSEALDVRRLPDGRVIYVLDHALSR